MIEPDKTPMCVIVFPADIINRDLCRCCNMTEEELIRSQLGPALALGDPMHLGQGNAASAAVEARVTITLDEDE